MNHLLTLIAIVVINGLVGCSSKRDTTAYQFPNNWVVAAAKPTRASEPSPAARDSFRNTISAFARALDSQNLTRSPQSEVANPEGLKDWTPWHLDGMICEFAFSERGLFGPISGAGETGFKIVWKQAKKSTRIPRAATGKTLEVSNKASVETIERAMEPTVQQVVKQGRVKDEITLRSTLHQEAQAFVSIVRAISALPHARRWIIKDFATQIAISGGGEVMTGVGLGASAQLELHFANIATPPDPKSDSPPVDTLAAIGDSLELAIEEWTKIQVPGQTFGLDIVNLGVAVTASGDVGIGHMGGRLAGVLGFIRNEKYKPISVGPIRTRAKIPLQPYGQEARPATNRPASDNSFLFIDSDDFRNGLAKALDMSDSLNAQVALISPRKWAVAEIGTRFAATAGGDLTIATLSGTAQIEFIFHPVAQPKVK